ncbi:hypothetical protein NVI2019_PEGOAJLN_02462 [Providencia alcalifaciens]|nr:hypothetical protein NVI2019_PEGOAJLN_02462 [Providencia alcalifaciens]SQI39383.1 Uncharacterised protein [Providencia alcalifaciens]
MLGGLVQLLTAIPIIGFVVSFIIIVSSSQSKGTFGISIGVILAFRSLMLLMWTSNLH